MNRAKNAGEQTMTCKPIPLAALVAAGISLMPARAAAYRPFDGTDADTVEAREIEIELGPVNYYRSLGQTSLIAPAFVFNYGLGSNTELVIDSSVLVPIKPAPGVPRAGLSGDDILLKHLFREGTIQGKTGVSIAAEGGVLLPEVNGITGLGASLDVITSYRWPWGSVHWNEWFQFTRDHHADLFSGAILEGPIEWKVRPVAELFYEKDFSGDATGSVLVGAIWTLGKSIAIDGGFRGARSGSAYVTEGRLGLTWSFDTEPGSSQD